MAIILAQKDIERFQSGVDRRNPDQCWPWQRCCVGRMGYGSFWLNGKMEYSHRVAWFLENGPIPELFEDLPSQICHSYDNPKCCNPAHLFSGNNEINQKDSVDKGRSSGFQRKGINHPQALKTEVEIKEMKRDLQEGVLTQKEIGLKYSVSQQKVSLISTGKIWSHVLI